MAGTLLLISLDGCWLALVSGSPQRFLCLVISCLADVKL